MAMKLPNWSSIVSRLHPALSRGRNQGYKEIVQPTQGGERKPEADVRHIIVTRLGIGIARQTFYRHHIAILKAGLYRSLAAQTDKDFEWVVICDRYISSENYESLEELVSSVRGRVLAFDPIKASRLMPTAKEIVGLRDGRRVLMTRIDDDDIVAKTFVAEIKAAASACQALPTVLALADGVEFEVALRSYRRYYHPSTPVGLSLLSDSKQVRNVYSGNHNMLHEIIKGIGGESKIIRTQKPMWVYMRRPLSDSSEHRSRKASSELKLVDEWFFRVLTACGLDKRWITSAESLLIGDHDPKPPIVGEICLNRLALKKEILSYIDELKKTGQEHSPRFHAAVSAFYAF